MVQLGRAGPYRPGPALGTPGSASFLTLRGTDVAPLEEQRRAAPAAARSGAMYKARRDPWGGGRRWGGPGESGGGGRVQPSKGMSEKEEVPPSMRVGQSTSRQAAADWPKTDARPGSQSTRRLGPAGLFRGILIRARRTSRWSSSPEWRSARGDSAWRMVN